MTSLYRRWYFVISWQIIVSVALKTRALLLLIHLIHRQKKYCLIYLHKKLVQCLFMPNYSTTLGFSSLLLRWIHETESGKLATFHVCVRMTDRQAKRLYFQGGFSWINRTTHQTDRSEGMSECVFVWREELGGLAD